MDILRRMSLRHFLRAGTASVLPAVVRSHMAIGAYLLEQIEQQWQDDDFFGRSDYPDILDVAPEGWWSDGEPDPVAGVDREANSKGDTKEY